MICSEKEFQVEDILKNCLTNLQTATNQCFLVFILKYEGQGYEKQFRPFCALFFSTFQIISAIPYGDQYAQYDLVTVQFDWFPMRFYISLFISITCTQRNKTILFIICSSIEFVSFEISLVYYVSHFCFKSLFLVYCMNNGC